MGREPALASKRAAIPTVVGVVLFATGLSAKSMGFVVAAGDPMSGWLLIILGSLFAIFGAILVYKGSWYPITFVIDSIEKHLFAKFS